MILIDRDEAERYAAQGIWGKATLDGLLSRAAAARPDQVALIDAAARGDWARPFPRHLTWIEIERRVAALAALFRETGLNPDDIVAIQLANTAETVIAHLAALRAGLIPAALPVLWRRRELADAAHTLAPAALIGVTRIGQTDHGELLRVTAAEAASVRQVFAFGAEVPDGVCPLDPPMGEQREAAHSAPPHREGNPADHLAILSFDADGRPLARSHNQWLAAATMVALSARLGPEAVLASILMPTSMAGIATGLAAWLLSGCRLVLAMPEGLSRLKAELAAEGATHLVLPGHLTEFLVPSGVRPVRVWRHGRMPAEPTDGTAEVVAVGELALWAAAGPGAFDIPLGRTEDLPQARLLETRLRGRVHRNGDGAPSGAMLSGRLVVRGPQTPGASLPGSGGRWDEAGPDNDGYWATDIDVRLSAARPATVRPLAMPGQPVAHGGIGVSPEALDALLAGFPGAREAACFAQDDPLLGRRLGAALVPGSDGDCSAAALAAYLTELGVAPCLIPRTVTLLDALPRDGEGLPRRDALSADAA